MESNQFRKLLVHADSRIGHQEQMQIKDFLRKQILFCVTVKPLFHWLHNSSIFIYFFYILFSAKLEKGEWKTETWSSWEQSDYRMPWAESRNCCRFREGQREIERKKERQPVTQRWKRPQQHGKIGGESRWQWGDCHFTGKLGQTELSNPDLTTRHFFAHSFSTICFNHPDTS